MHVQAKVNAHIARLVFAYLIKDRLGQPMYGTNTHYMNMLLENMLAADTSEFKFSFPTNLGPGSYSVATALTKTETHLCGNYE